MGFPLAIIIPAYKTRFLREALQSIAGQTNQNFQLYVGDDCSPEPVAQIVGQFSDRLNIRYQRFDANLGGVSLARQWERCFRLGNEPWIWCFADDDCMEPGCVAAFFEALEGTAGRHDAYRFNTRWIDTANQVMAESPSHPPDENGADFLRARLGGSRNSVIQELIFSRPAWEKTGIPDFPLGWASDDAFIAQLSRRRPVRLIPGPRVCWRVSDINLSHAGARAGAAKRISASAKFVRWTLDYFADQPETARAEVRQLTRQWFNGYVAGSEQILGWQNCLEIERLTAGSWGCPAGAGLWWAGKNNCHVALQKVKRRLFRAGRVTI